MESNPAKRRKLEHAGPTAPLVSRASSFALASEELVRTVRLEAETAFTRGDDLLHKVKSTIEEIECHGPRLIYEAASELEKKHNIRVPFPEPRPSADSQLKVSIVKPTKFNVVGSYFSKTMVKSQDKPAIDMIFELPEEVLQPKDYLDMRYIFKRAYYIAAVAAELQKKLKGSVALSWKRLHGNQLTPVLVVQQLESGSARKDEGQENTETSKSSYRLRIIPCAPDGLFPAKKLVSTACLLRKGGLENEQSAGTKPTPFYNSTLKADACFTQYLRVLRQAEKSCSSFKDACVLGRIWLQQRGFGGVMSQGGFGHFEWAALLALLLQTGARKGQSSLSSSLTAPQLFKAMIQFLASANFVKKPCVLGTQEDDSASWKEDGPVLYDSTRKMNIAFKMSPWSAASLIQHAKWTHSLLGNNLVDQFSSTFIVKADVLLQSFDTVVEVNFDAASFKTKHADHRSHAWDVAEKIHSVLKRGLGDKARLIHVKTPAEASWELSEDTAVSDKSRSLWVGILHDPAHMSRKTDRGPLVEEKKDAEDFQRFWGDKSELRRFKDGTTCETLIWNSDSADDICEEMVRYILQRHLRLGFLREDLTFFGKGLASLIPIQNTDSAYFNLARKEYDVFEQDLRGLEDLPLHIRQVRPGCPEFRFASVKPPSFDSTKSGPRPMDVTVYFEASGKWPENLSAIQRTKVAFLLKIGSVLEEAKPGAVTSHLGLEDAKQDIENLAFLDVVYETGSSFRLRIHSDLEETLLERRTKDKTLDQHIRTDAATLLANFKRLYTTLPAHTQTFHTYSTRFPALSPTARLLKYWFNSHKLTCHFTDEFIELATLHVFLNPQPWDSPSSPNTGFLRALMFLARWDWRSEPLVLNTSGEMTPADQAGIETRLEAWRKLDPNLNHTVLFVASSDDTSGTAYTTLNGEAKPFKVVATRMTTLARSATRLIKDQGLQLELKALFTPSLKDYDVLLHLNKKVIKSLTKTYPTNSAGQHTEDGPGHRPSKFKNLDGHFGQAPLPLPQHPVDTFLAELNRVYAGPLLFFRGGEEDVVIGGIWIPQMQRRSFRVHLPCSYGPVAEGKDVKMKKGGAGDETDEESSSDDDDEDVVEINKTAILAEIARIGGDLVERIEMKGL